VAHVPRAGGIPQPNELDELENHETKWESSSKLPEGETISSVVSEIYLGSWWSHHGVFYNSFFKVCSGLTIV